ncbi:MAG TPA: Crp/Fnr family transcriptional regulator [Pelobium sp.]|nr:Crp/Fnr family transcriptional regulator [Pelobium sp.]
MYELFFKSFRQKVPLTVQEETQLKRYLTPKKLRKKQYLLQEGDVCKSIAFIEKGVLKAYSVDEKGNEHIIQFGLEGWIISDLYSFLTGESATYNIDAIEDSEVLLISKSAHEELLREMPAYETFTRLNITGAYLAMQKRLTSVISAPLKEQYTDFIALYPDIVQRVPQHMIASYLGLKPETLSRVRQKIAQK